MKRSLVLSAIIMWIAGCPDGAVAQTYRVCAAEVNSECPPPSARKQ
jgi:hypothetical protein